MSVFHLGALPPPQLRACIDRLLSIHPIRLEVVCLLAILEVSILLDWRDLALRQELALLHMNGR